MFNSLSAQLCHAYLKNIWNTKAQTNINHPTNWNIDHWLHISRPGYMILQRVQRNISDHLPQMLFSNQWHLEAPDGKKDEEKSASRSGEEVCISKVIRWWSNPPKKVEIVQSLQRSREDCCLSGISSLNLHAFCYLFFREVTSILEPWIWGYENNQLNTNRKKLNVKQTTVEIGEFWVIVHIHW